MAQARRKGPAKRARTGAGGWTGLALLLAGMLIGSLATMLWHGARTADDGIGAGIRRMVEDSRQTPATASGGANEENAQSGRPSTEFTFFQLLPEIEVEAPVAEPANAPSNAAATATESPKPTATEQPAARDSAYMLQAGSYQRRADADRLKATLALSGMVSAIQKVTIQGRGDFYRVRLGPFATYREMVKADEQLSRAGIKGLRLKMFKSG